MGHRCNLLLAEGGRLDAHYSHWGALSVLTVALRGPDRLISMIQECTKDDKLIQDAVFAEAIAFVDRDRHELMIWGGVFIKHIPVVRRAYMQALRAVWQGWQVDWCQDGIVDAWRRAGIESPKFHKAPKPIAEEDLRKTGHTWVTVVTDRADDFSFWPDADSLLLVGPRIVDYCGERQRGRPPLEDNLGGGILIDPARQTMAWWYCGANPPEAQLAEAWSGWQVSQLAGGLPEQMDRSGRDGREFALSQERIDECLAHDLSRSSDFDPIAVIRKLSGHEVPCKGERRASLAEGVITEADQERLLALIRRDLEATVGPVATPIALEASGRQRLFADSLADYERRVIDDVQQAVHDDFLDTSWPRCPHHPNHPLWYSEGWWRCDRAGAIARLGDLKR